MSENTINQAATENYTGYITLGERSVKTRANGTVVANNDKALLPRVKRFKAELFGAVNSKAAGYTGQYYLLVKIDVDGRPELAGLRDRWVAASTVAAACGQTCKKTYKTLSEAIEAGHEMKRAWGVAKAPKEKKTATKKDLLAWIDRAQELMAARGIKLEDEAPLAAAM